MVYVNINVANIVVVVYVNTWNSSHVVQDRAIIS